jgi:ACT domain
VPTRACNARVRRDRASIRLGVDIIHRQQLDDLIKRLTRIRSVLGVERVSQGATR